MRKQVPQKPAPKAARKANLADSAGSTALVRQSSGELSTTEDGVPASQRRYSSTPEFDRSDLQMPRLKIGQPGTPEVLDGAAQAGQFIFPGSDPVDSVILVPLVFGKGRIYSTDDDGILCQSGDSIHGEGDPGGNCARCPFNQWTKDKKGNNIKPQCTFYYSYGVYSETHGSIAAWDVRGAGLRPATGLNTLIQKLKMGNFAIEVTSNKNVAGKNTWYTPVIKQIKVKDSVLQQAAEMSSF